MQDPRAAADELERSMRALKFCGAMINGHTNGLPDFHSGATGIPGSFTEGLLLRPIQREVIEPI
jgi:predicted TIM-barrel fold metal-dependent hydrolase